MDEKLFDEQNRNRSNKPGTVCHHGYNLCSATGFILGPSLFSLYINILPDYTRNTAMVMYADDVAVLFSNNNSSVIEYTPNDEMKIVKKYK